jgi:hypothetical protein
MVEAYSTELKDSVGTPADSVRYEGNRTREDIKSLEFRLLTGGVVGRASQFPEDTAEVLLITANLKGARASFTRRNVGVLFRAQLAATFPICPQAV